MAMKIGPLELVAVHFEGKGYYAVVRGKEKDGIEVEFRVPLSFGFRRDRKEPPTLEDMRAAAASAVGRFCAETALKINPAFVSARVETFKRAQGLRKLAPSK